MSSTPVSLRLRQAQGDELRELFAVVARYRWRHGGEVLLRFILRGLIVGAALVVIVSIVDWWLEAGVQPTWLWSALLLPAVGALGLALAFWPSERQAARMADHRLGLDERVGTAVELGRGAHGGRFDRLQLQDAIAHVATAPRRWPSPVVSLKRELFFAF